MTQKTFKINLLDIQPSQLYISKRKLAIVKEAFEEREFLSLGIIPVKKLNEEIIFVDGHTRAFVAYLNGVEFIEVEWETDSLDWEMYEICVKWCKDAEIKSISDLKNRIIPHDDYEVLWYKRCKEMQTDLLNKRKSR